MGAILSTRCLLWKQNQTLTTAAVAPTAHPAPASFRMATSANAFCGGHSPFLCPVPSVLLSNSFELFGFLLWFHFPQQSFRTIQTENHACSVTDCTVLSREDFLLLVLSNVKKRTMFHQSLFGITHSKKNRYFK